ncbi:MAG: hypothetical protein AVDCRST_MAG77-5633, partial [uncultured Chloroflexi bacterium]
VRPALTCRVSAVLWRRVSRQRHARARLANTNRQCHRRSHGLPPRGRGYHSDRIVRHRARRPSARPAGTGCTGRRCCGPCGRSRARRSPRAL